MNPITAFLTIACLVIGAALVATGYLFPGVVVVVVAILVVSPSHRSCRPDLAARDDRLVDAVSAFVGADRRR